MKTGLNLPTVLDRWAENEAGRQQLATIVATIADAGIKLSRVIARHDLVDYGSVGGSENADGDLQKALDVFSHQLYEKALERLPLTFIASEERELLRELDPGARYGVALDPLDGSSNIDTNLSIGTIFSVLEVSAADLFEIPPGKCQRAAGFICFGPQTRLTLSLGDGTQVFLLDPETGEFLLVEDHVEIPPARPEFAINTSNYRFWDDNVRHFIDDCIAGQDGNLGRDFNMRWNASLVAEAGRILERGGVFLYPGDSRPGYGSGRLRLLYEAVPLAMIVEQAGGRACDGNEHILGKRLESLHQRVPLIFGSHDRVEEVIDYISGQALETTHFPLFEHRGLFRN